MFCLLSLYIEYRLDLMSKQTRSRCHFGILTLGYFSAFSHFVDLMINLFEQKITNQSINLINTEKKVNYRHWMLLKTEMINAKVPIGLIKVNSTNTKDRVQGY